LKCGARKLKAFGNTAHTLSGKVNVSMTYQQRRKQVARHAPKFLLLCFSGNQTSGSPNSVIYRPRYPRHID